MRGSQLFAEIGVRYGVFDASMVFYARRSGSDTGVSEVLNVKGCCCSRDHLTPREVEVTVLLAGGLSNFQIARRMTLSGHTVSTYVIDAMHRLGARNRTELVARCYANGLLEAGSWPPEATGRRCITQLGPATRP